MTIQTDNREQASESTRTLTHRERLHAVLRYEPYDRLPLVHFGYWRLTLQKWANEGHLDKEEILDWDDANEVDARVSRKLGFDFNWITTLRPKTYLFPEFDREVIAELPDGKTHVRNRYGVTELESPGAYSIPAEVAYLLKDRDSWKSEYQWRLKWDERRVTESLVCVDQQKRVRYDEGGLEWLRSGEREYPYGYFCGSLLGMIRNTVGMEHLGMMSLLEPDLLQEIIQSVSDVCYKAALFVLEAGARFDFVHFWEDMCFKSGPLVSPTVFDSMVGPHYRRLTELFRNYGVDLVSVDSDGWIDRLIPTWLNNGVSIMFPIEVGTWGGSIQPWREQYGRSIRGVGGVQKHVFAEDRQAVDREIERIRPLVELGGYIPCPDHRIAADAEWDLVRYYCDRMRETFGARGGF